MTELDATVIAEEDAARVHQRVEKGATPKSIIKLTTTLLVARIDGFESDNASNRARASLKKSKGATTASEHLIRACGQAVYAVVRTLNPEDARSLIIWLVGRGTGDHGFLHPVIEMMGESSGPEELQQLAASLYGTMAKMNEIDIKLFRQDIGQLNLAKKGIIRGMRLDAHWALHEGDGVEARSLLVQARQMAKRWIGESKSAESAGFDAEMEPYW